MATQVARSNPATNRSLSSVQRVLRTLIWFGLFFVLLIRP